MMEEEVAGVPSHPEKARSQGRMESSKRIDIIAKHFPVNTHFLHHL